MAEGRQATLLDYEGFVEKFKPRKTTDDCYTPPAVYEALMGVLAARFPWLAEARIMRPFRPGGDYMAEDYPGDCAVVDNPPFSILSEIVRSYQRLGVRFWLFAPTLTLFHYCAIPGVTAVVCNASVTYDNGAVVNTSFLTNFTPELAARVDGELCAAIEDAMERAKTPAPSKKALLWPPEVCSSALLGKIAKQGVSLDIPRSESLPIKEMDCGQTVFGGGLLLSERLAAERLAAERLAAERLAAERLAAERLAVVERSVIALSDREREMVAMLGKKA